MAPRRDQHQPARIVEEDPTAVTIQGIPPRIPMVGIVSAVFRCDNGSAGTGGLRAAATLAALVLVSACTVQEAGSDPPNGFTPDPSAGENPSATSPTSAGVPSDTPHVGTPGAALDRAARGGPGFPVSLKDATGQVLVFETPPGRIVSLVPSATRTLEALGVGNLLVGRTAYDTTATLAHLPSVGGGLQPNLETLLALRPDLVIRYGGESDRATTRRLSEMEVRHFAVRPDRVEDVRTLIRDLGTVTGRRRQADSLLADVDASFQEIRARIAGRPPVRVAYLLGGNPPWVAGPGTFIDELLSAAGGENPFADLKVPYGPVSPEEFLARDIDLLLAPEGGEVFLPSPSPRLVRVSPAMELPGPDLARFAGELARLLHPQVFR